MTGTNGGCGNVGLEAELVVTLLVCCFTWPFGFDLNVPDIYSYGPLVFHFLTLIEARVPTPPRTRNVITFLPSPTDIFPFKF